MYLGVFGGGRARNGLRWLLVMGAAFALTARARAQGIDSGLSLVQLAQAVAESPRVLGDNYRWMRVRSLGTPTALAADRAAIAYLHSRGIRLCVLVSGPGAGPSGVRPGQGRALPLDLREAHQWAVNLGQTYPGIDAWEIGNEPDVGFVPENSENYLALLKTCYLGFKRGAELYRAQGLPASAADTPLPERSGASGPLGPSFHKVEALLPRTAVSTAPSGFQGSRVVMAALALPPGPYLEQLLAGDLLSYSDGFNFHYYGYSADFSGVYDQFHQAVSDFTARMKGPWRNLPVFVTEYGYGMLYEETRDAVAARLKQWRWFESVYGQVRQLGIEAPMAFYLQPYLEFSTNEYGLAARNRLDFLGTEFDAAPAAMRSLLSEKVSGATPTPALAYLSTASRRPYRVRDWPAPVGTPSPVVLDLISGAGTFPMKSYGGYLATQPKGVEWMTGQVELVIYNFSEQTQTGRLAISGVDYTAPPEVAREIVLVPGERRTIPVSVAVSTGAFRKKPCEVRFISSAEAGSAGLRTSFYPNATPIPRHVYLDLFTTTEAESTRHRQSLVARALVPQELPGNRKGRWSCVGDMEVSEGESTWSFSISALPPDRRRACSAELPLPDGLRLSPELLLSLDYRTRESHTPSAADMQGDALDICIRTANGNLYEAWPRLLTKSSWQPYLQAAGNFSMMFYGRAHLPWRFSDNEPVSLVLFFRPSALPATYEVRRPAIVWHGPVTAFSPLKTAEP